MTNFRLDDEICLVTGAGAGIGAAIAQTFARAGAIVVVTNRETSDAEAVVAGIIENGGKAMAVTCDVTDEGQCLKAIDAAVAAFGRLTILVNNAGGGGPRPFDMPITDFRRAYELNVFSLFRLMQLAAPHIERAGGGSILNISSMAGENTASRMASYASSKAATNHLTRNVAVDLGPRNIRVNAIAPGAIRTQALASVLTPEIEMAMLKRTPLGRLGEPQDIANAALFLCSRAASWISGQVLTVSGGGAQELE